MEAIENYLEKITFQDIHFSNYLCLLIPILGYNRKTIDFLQLLRYNKLKV